MKPLLFSAFLLLACQTIAAERPATKVVGGEDITRSYPWMAGLHVYDAGAFEGAGGFDPEPFCGGSLIAPGWVLSAAHCFTSAGNGDNPGSYSPQADELIIRIDTPDLNDQPDHFAQDIIAHPQYGVADGSDDSDIVLVQLATKANVDTISLANGAIMSQLETSTILNDVVRIIGWGIYDDEEFDPADAGNGNQPDFLQEVDLDYLPFVNTRCRNAWDGLTMNMICAWEPNPPVTAPFGQDACFGDSGGPLMLPASTILSAATVTHDWLLGATSFGSSTCSSISQPGVYAKVANFDSWIEQTTEAAGDALIDIRADVVVPDTTRPDLDFTVEAIVTNASRSNDAGAPVMELTMSDASLAPVNATGCATITDGWRCTLGTLSAGQSHNRSFTVSWNGADEDLADAAIQVYANEDDYRVANNSTSSRSTVTLLPDPTLDPFQVLAKKDLVASVAITASNQSLLNSSNDTTLVLDIPAGLTVMDDAGCTVVSPVQLSCALGSLAADTSQQIGLQLEGEGTFALTATLQNSNGDISAGDTQRTLNITLKKKSSGGGSMMPLWLVSAALLYLRRKSRNQSSS